MAKPSAETQLKILKRELNRIKAQYDHERQRAETAVVYQARLQAEVNEWKQRFDLLLARAPKESQ